MKANEMWKLYINSEAYNKAKNENTDNTAACNNAAAYDTWAFGADSDKLAQLVLSGEKTATSSSYPLYETYGEELPREGEYSVILNSRDEAVCVIITTRVYVIPFSEVSEHHAYSEGEGDKSPEYWRSVHRDFFAEELREAGLEFTEDMLVVCEEFKVVYKIS